MIRTAKLKNQVWPKIIRPCELLIWMSPPCHFFLYDLIQMWVSEDVFSPIFQDDDQHSEINQNKYVVYFDQLLGAARTQKLVETLFSAVFNLFLLISNLFQWFHGWNHCKTSGNGPKMDFAYSSRLVDMQKLVDSLRGYREIVFFRLIFKCFDQLLGVRSTQKLVEIHNKNALFASFSIILHQNLAKTCEKH